MFIQTGYGLEGALPDATCFDITHNVIAPHFKKEDYTGGLRGGYDRDDAGGPRRIQRQRAKLARKAKADAGSGLPIGLIIFLIIVFIFIVFTIRARREATRLRLQRLGRAVHRRIWRRRRLGWGQLGGGGFSGFSGGGGSFGGGGAGSSW